MRIALGLFLLPLACGQYVRLPVGDAGAGGVVMEDANVDMDVIFQDTSPVDAAPPPPPSPKFFFMATESPPGPTEAVETWGGILRFDLADDFQTAVSKPGIPHIPKNHLHDPDSLAFRKNSAKLFVGNRHGNNSGDGVPGSITRFLYTEMTETFTFNGEITTGLKAVAQIALSHQEDALYAANYGDGTIARFKFIGANPIPDAMYSMGGNSPLGLAVSPDGKVLFATQVFSAAIRRFDTTTGMEILPVAWTAPNNGRLHWMTSIDGGSNTGEIFASDILGPIYQLTVNAKNELTLKNTIMDAHPISVALSPSGFELFGANNDFINNTMHEVSRFKLSGTWNASGTIPTMKGMGGIITFRAYDPQYPPNKIN